MKPVNIQSILAKHPQGSFLNIADFNDTAFGAVDIEGESPVWEMHPDTDEMFFVQEGQVDITLLMPDAAETVQIFPGEIYVVPKGIWHKPSAPKGAKFVYFTPGQSLHSDAADPR